jgi:hypothetical protein
MPTTRHATVVDFAVYKAANPRRANQRPITWARPPVATMSTRAIEHRARMLAHLAAARARVSAIRALCRG